MLILKELEVKDEVDQGHTIFENHSSHKHPDAKIGIDQNKLNRLKSKVERRSSDVTLEKMRAGDRRENETICASLKKYQTLPPKIRLSNLVSTMLCLLYGKLSIF